MSLRAHVTKCRARRLWSGWRRSSASCRKGLWGPQVGLHSSSPSLPPARKGVFTAGGHHLRPSPPRSQPLAGPWGPGRAPTQAPDAGARLLGQGILQSWTPQSLVWERGRGQKPHTFKESVSDGWDPWLCPWEPHRCSAREPAPARKGASWLEGFTYGLPSRSLPPE